MYVCLSVCGGNVPVRQRQVTGRWCRWWDGIVTPVAAGTPLYICTYVLRSIDCSIDPYVMYTTGNSIRHRTVVFSQKRRDIWSFSLRYHQRYQLLNYTLCHIAWFCIYILAVCRCKNPSTDGVKNMQYLSAFHVWLKLPGASQHLPAA